MDDHKLDAMVALLPINSDWCKMDLPHLTIVYCGKMSDMQPTGFNALAKDVMSIAMMTNPVTLRVKGVEVFGTEDTERVDVLRMQLSPELYAMRHFLQDWDTGEFPDFKPHCTIGPMGTFVQDVPSYVAFDRIMVAWGEDQLTFWLRRNP